MIICPKAQKSLEVINYSMQANDSLQIYGNNARKKQFHNVLDLWKSANSLSFIDTARVVYGRVYVAVRCPSPVCLSVCLFQHSAVARRCGRFAAVGGRCRSIAARRVCSRRGRLSIHICSGTAGSSKCEQCHIVS